ncbi:MFS general substrate transporter [Dothidotthia symphoricarpi CBS 119687]|uniref:MFS general substrate transporter n=1 Tax=Dothidotthia symphoricarpi CBS 119687 TaxID=1392245 RepID=A0A6A6ABX1_9PLEO|nr:MFS general substrate transporter [Dothidotthia symphoricarpi CBS 119687]KAF2129309.1 MFS general substrate transporter [Dothidotthia symphoricarpi CBS 119687]
MRHHGLFDIQPVSDIASPEPTLQKSKGKAPQRLEDVGVLPDSGFEDVLAGKSRNMSTDPVTNSSEQEPQAWPQTPKTPNALEMSRPPSPSREEAVGLIRMWNGDPMTKWRILCCCLIYFSNGLNDAVVGALIPYMEVYYQASHTIMSLVFVGNAAGFILAAFFTNVILGRIGRAKTLILAELIQLSAYTILVCTPPYALVVISFFLLGYGAAMNLALNNVYCANTHPSSVILGASHGAYGIGGIIAPIIGTAIVSRGILWSRFYFITIGLRLCCIAFAAWAFWSYQEDSPQTLLNAIELTASRQPADEDSESKSKDLKLALKNKVTIFGALFIFAYQGAEVAISGWFISYLINYRDGDPAKVGYVTAGFWGGITVGRFVLTHAAPKIGERWFVVGLTLGTVVLQLLAWLTPNIIGNAVAVCLLGLLLGPVYPCAQTVFSRSMPRHIQTTAIGFIGGAGSSGGAVAPFTTGILAQAAGTWVLHPVCLGLYGAMLACWFALPKVHKRTE